MGDGWLDKFILIMLYLHGGSSFADEDLVTAGNLNISIQLIIAAETTESTAEVLQIR